MGAPIAGQAGWSKTADAVDWQPKFHGAVAQQHTLYRRGDQVVGVYVGYYRDQGPERKAVSSVNVLVSSENPIWNPIGAGRIDVPTNGAALPWRTTHLLGKTGGLNSPRRHRTAWQSYWIDDRFTDGDVEAKIRGALGLLAGRGDDAAIVVLHTDLPPEEGGTRLLIEFSQAHLPSLREALRQVRATR
jgi:EpsI family protein